MNTSILRQAGLVLLAIAILSTQTASADDGGYVTPKPGSFRAIMSIKDPSHYGPHLPAADIPSTYVAPVPGSWKAIMSVKDPSRYGPHLPAADIPSKYVAPAPGSALALLSVKDPMRYRELTRK